MEANTVFNPSNASTDEFDFFIKQYESDNGFKNDYKDNLMANLYSTIDILKREPNEMSSDHYSTNLISQIVFVNMMKLVETSSTHVINKSSTIIRSFLGSSIADMYSYLQLLLNKELKYLLLHVSANDVNKNTISNIIINNILQLKHYVESKLPKCVLYISAQSVRTDNHKANTILKNVTEKLK